MSEAVAIALEALPDGVELRDLGTHRLKDLAAPEHVYQISAADLDDQFPPLRSVDVVRNNLTAPTTAFVGRTDEQKSLLDLLAEQRLVTITGSGGVGKTRLAREVAGALVDRFPDGVWFVDFTAARNPGAVGRATADAVGAKDDPVRTPAEALAEHLRTTTTLLVLDNCEHVAEDTGALVAGVLAAAPGVRVLITSRQPIGLAGERVWRVPPLSGATAVELFVDRALALVPDRDFDEADRAAITRLCDQLEGIPLAIEMAAARVPEMSSIAALADAFRDRLAVGAADDAGAAPSRQRTMRATIEWSHELLAPEERRLLRRLSAFLGGFTLDAAEGVCADDRLDAFDVLDLLGHLVAQSLVQADEDGAEFRYRLLEVVREFAAERLAEGPEFDSVQSRHQAWFMQLTEREAAQLYGLGFKDALDTLERELPNLRRAINWDGEGLEEDVRYRIVVALHRVWVLRGYVEEGLRAAGVVLATPVTRRGWRVSVLVNAAALAEQQGDGAYAAALYREADALLAEIEADIESWGAALDQEARRGYFANSAGQRAWCLVRQAILAHDRVGAAGLAHDAIALARSAGGHALALVLSGAGEVAYVDGRFEDADAAFAESLPLFEAAGDQVEAAQTKLRLGATAYTQGRFGRAEALYREALAASEAGGASRGQAEALRNLADVAFLTGGAEARALSADACEQLDALGDLKGVSAALVLRVRSGEADQAAAAIDAAQRLRDDSLLVEAVVAAAEASPTDARLHEWAARAEAAVASLPAWRRPGVTAARSLAEADATGFVAAADELGPEPQAIALIEVLRLAAAASFDADLQRAASALCETVVRGLRSCEDAGTTPPLGAWRDELRGLAGDALRDQSTNKE